MESALGTEDKELLGTIKARISEIVEGQFAKGKAVYLSWLGNELGPYRILLEQHTGTKLVQYLRANFNYAFTTAGPHNNTLCLAPAGTNAARLVDPQGATDPGKENSSLRSGKSIPRYVPALWAAFIKPLESGQNGRFINLTTLTFGPDGPALEVDPKDDICFIKPELIATPGTSDPEQVAERIEGWLKDMKLDGRHYIVGQKGESFTRADSAFAVFVKALTPEQLKRTSLPVDVVQALLKSKP